MFRINHLRMLIVAGSVVAAFVGVPPAVAAPVQTDHVEAELVSEAASVQPGVPFWIALRLKMDEDWHVYWRNPGDAGLPPTIEWDVPDGVTISEFAWPYPHRIALPEVVDYGYDDEVFLLAEVTPPSDFAPGDSLTIRGAASWLVCETVCIPGDAELELTLPVAAGAPQPNRQWSDAFAATRARLPRSLSEWSVAATAEGDKFVLHVAAAGGPERVPRQLTFFPQDPGIIDNVAQQRVRATGDSTTVELTPSILVDRTPPRLKGILVAEGGWPSSGGAVPALTVDAPLLSDTGASVGSANASGVPPVSSATGTLSLPTAVAFAFVGGLLLNLMPCVFPVLGIKILGFVQQAGESAARARLHGLAFAVGVLVSFWVLAGALLALRAGGEQLGWGFQLQSPAFVVAMAFVFFTFALSLLGVFEFGIGVMGLAARFEGGKGYSGSFFSGVLATAVATPCTAPYMGPALGYALTMSAAVALLVFTALGVGMALPYVVLSSVPALMQRLPRPGPWMEAFKQFMAFPLLATVVLLGWVLGRQAGADAIIALLGGLLLVGLGAWIIGRWGAPRSSPRVRALARVAALALLLAAIGVAVPRGDEADATTTSVGALKPQDPDWLAYSADRIAELRAAGRPVFVDFTAAWCLTCQVNEHVALNDEAVRAQFRELDIALVKADWTSRSPEITQALEAFGRNSVPLYVLYPPAGRGEPKMLPEVLTRGNVLEALDALSP